MLARREVSPRGREHREGLDYPAGAENRARGRGLLRREPSCGRSSVRDLMFVSLLNPCVEGLMPSVTTFGYRTYKEVIKVTWDNKGGP